jgi:superfamily II DNA/RNA helicase
MGFDKPTPIQQQSIPIILSGKDLIACAQTGTGKTAAYVLPMIEKVIREGHDHVNTLVLAPTRELAVQIDQQVEALGYFTGVGSMAVYGGGDGITWEQQKKAIKEGIDLVVATPGRLISFLAAGDIKLDKLKHLVLDEADRMLDMGFHDDIMRIVSYLPKERQTLLFSATMPPKIRTLAGRLLNQPEQINIAISKPAEGIVQQCYEVDDAHKLDLISKILREGGFGSVIVFASTKEKVKRLDSALRKINFKCQAFHSDLDQREREEIMRSFKNQQLNMIIGTDVLSRGIDVEGIDLVVNYDVPPDPEDYVHRIGRTARAERTGTAITFVNSDDNSRFRRIEELIGKEVTRVPNPEGIPAMEMKAPSKSHHRGQRPNHRKGPPRKFHKPRKKPEGE